MNNKFVIAGVALLALAALTLSGCGKKTTTTETNTAKNTNTVVTEAPYIMSGSTKVFNLKLANGLLNYKTMTFYAGDTIEVRLTSDDQPVNFKFQEVPAAASTNGIFGTIIQENDQGGTYHLVCSDRDCGNIALTVVPKANTNSTTGSNTNGTTNTNTTANTNAASQVSKVEFQRIPAGATFSPTNTYETTSSFQVGDQFGLSVTGTFKTGDKSTFSVTDSTGREIEPQGMSSNLQTGTNGTCCFSLPSAAGNYFIKVFVNGVETRSTSITVSAK